MDETLGTDQQLISRLAAGGVQVVHTAGSKSQQLVGTSAVVCYMKTRNGTFEAAFLTDVSAAEQLRVCETQSASRHPYSISGRTMDAAYPVYCSLRARARTPRATCFAEATSSAERRSWCGDGSLASVQELGAG
jgi:hypothetical protein